MKIGFSFVGGSKNFWIPLNYFCLAPYSIAMRHFGPLVICAALVWLAVGAVPYWVNAVIAGAMLSKPPTPPPAAASTAVHCHLDRSTVAVFVPLVLAWSIRAWSLRGRVLGMRLLRGTLETTLLVLAFWFVCLEFPISHPLKELIVGPCGPLR